MSDFWSQLRGWIATWQWGNVPSWFSAGSFMAAAIVIYRDRRLRKKQQLDSIAVRLEVSTVMLGRHSDASPTAIRFHATGTNEETDRTSAKVLMKNSSDQAVCVESVSCFLRARRLNGRGLMQVENIFRDITLAPGQSVDKEVMSFRSKILDCREDMYKDEKGKYKSNLMFDESRQERIKKLVVLGRMNRRWSVVPKTGRARVFASAVLPFATATFATSNKFIVAFRAITDPIYRVVIFLASVLRGLGEALANVAVNLAAAIIEFVRRLRRW